MGAGALAVGGTGTTALRSVGCFGLVVSN